MPTIATIGFNHCGSAFAKQVIAYLPHLCQRQGFFFLSGGCVLRTHRVKVNQDPRPPRDVFLVTSEFLPVYGSAESIGRSLERLACYRIKRAINRIRLEAVKLPKRILQV